VEAASATASQGRLESDKARRIVEAMRASVGLRGAAGSTFDQVAQAAGVSRGLLHYYFGSKERLLVEVVRHDCDIRIAALRESLAQAGSVDELIETMLAGFHSFVEEEGAAAPALIFELFTASRHNEEIRDELGELYRSVRVTVAEALTAKEREGVVRLRADAGSVASIIFAMADGAALQILSDPSWDATAALATGVTAVRHLLGE
jgi:AcrR family transcriptional regulator